MGWTGYSKEIKSKSIKINVIRNLDKNIKGKFVGIKEEGSTGSLLFEFENKVDLCSNPISYSITILVKAEPKLCFRLLKGFTEYTLDELRGITNVYDNEIHWESWIVKKTTYKR